MLDIQRIQKDLIRRKSHCPLQRARQAFRCLPRQPVDKVKIDAGKFRFHQDLRRFLCPPAVMKSAQPGKLTLVKTLDPHTDPGNTRFFQQAYLPPVGLLRRSLYHDPAVFPQRHISSDIPKYPLQLPDIQKQRRTAADGKITKHGITGQNFPVPLHLTRQRIQIGVPLRPAAACHGEQVAVSAPALTKGQVKVQAVPLTRQIFHIIAQIYVM